MLRAVPLCLLASTSWQILSSFLCFLKNVSSNSRPRSRLRFWSRDEGLVLPPHVGSTFLHARAESGPYSWAPLPLSAFCDHAAAACLPLGRTIGHEGLAEIILSTPSDALLVDQITLVHSSSTFNCWISSVRRCVEPGEVFRDERKSILKYALPGFHVNPHMISKVTRVRGIHKTPPCIATQVTDLMLSVYSLHTSLSGT